VQELSHPGITERQESLGNMWTAYPTFFSAALFLILVYLIVREIKKEKGSFLKLAIYFIIAIITFWRVAIDI
jgi:hypothetical protein